MKDTNYKYKIILGLFVSCTILLMARSSYLNTKGTPQSHSNTYRVNTHDRYLVANLKNNRANINIKEKNTGQNHQYSVDFSDSFRILNDIPAEYSKEQQDYQKANKALITQATKAYGIIISNDYKIVRFCSKYHPVTKWKNRFDEHFKTQKHKAELIISNAYGPSETKVLERALVTNPSIINFFEQQIENDYQLVKTSKHNEGYHNFSKIQYCQMLDDDVNISLYLKTLDTSFKNLLPDF